MRLMILENRRLRTTLRASAENLSIGSSPECAIHLPDPTISSHQASLSQDPDGGWWLEIVDTSVPTSLNRAIQKSRAKLRHADEIEMRSFMIRLFMESDKTRDELQRERMLALTKKHGESLPLDTMTQKAEDPITVSRELLEQLSILAVRLEQKESIRDILTPLLRSLLRTLDARRAWVGIRKHADGDFDWTLGLDDRGQPTDRPAFSERMQLRCLAHTQYLCSPTAPATDVRSAMAVPLVCQSGNLGMFYVENSPQDAPYDEKSLHTLSALACSVAMPIENVLRQTVTKQRAFVATQQTVARTTQDSLTPKALPLWDSLQVAAYRHMGASKCCDIYDIIQLRDKRASFITARFDLHEAHLPRHFSELRAMFRAAALYSEPPHLFARALNWLLYEPDSERGIHAAMAWLNPDTGKVQFCIAGDGVRLGAIRADGTCDVHAADGMPAIGASRAPAYEIQSLELAKGDSLVLATGGVLTAKNSDGEPFGWDNLHDCLCDGLGAAPSTTLSELDSDLNEFIAEGECPDDITLVMAQRV